MRVLRILLTLLPLPVQRGRWFSLLTSIHLPNALYFNRRVGLAFRGSRRRDSH